MELLGVIFSGIAAVGVVLGIAVASKPWLAIVGTRRGREEHILASYRKMFGRTYQLVTNDLDEDGKTKPANARTFTQVVGNEMYLHCTDETEAWQRYRDTHEI